MAQQKMPGGLAGHDFDAMIKRNSDAMSAMMQSCGGMLEQWNRLNAETMEFCARRWKEDLEMPARLASSREAGDVAEVYAGFARQMIADYDDHARRVMDFVDGLRPVAAQEPASTEAPKPAKTAKAKVTRKPAKVSAVVGAMPNAKPKAPVKKTVEPAPTKAEAKPAKAPAVVEATPVAKPKATVKKVTAVATAPAKATEKPAKATVEATPVAKPKAPVKKIAAVAGAQAKAAPRVSQPAPAKIISENGVSLPSVSVQAEKALPKANTEPAPKPIKAAPKTRRTAVKTSSPKAASAPKAKPSAVKAASKAPKPAEKSTTGQPAKSVAAAKPAPVAAKPIAVAAKPAAGTANGAAKPAAAGVQKTQ